MSAPSTAELYRRHIGAGRALVGELTGGGVEVASSGCMVTDADGRQYLDCGGYGVFLLGHGHPAVVGAVRDQLERHPLATRVLLEPVVAEAAAALAAVAPGDLEHVFFTTSGAEAVELALKLGRAAGRRRVVAMDGGYHGKTLGALSATGRALYRAPFGPLLPDVSHVPFGDAAALRGRLAEGPPATVVLEPIQAEGGVIIPPPGYLRAVHDACRDHGALLVMDEIQTGLGRLGHWWGVDREAVVPDVLLAGKVLSGGVMPVAALLAGDETFAPIDRDPFIHSSTFGGSPLAAAAAKAALDVIASEGLVARAAALGATLLAELAAILGAHCPERVRDVRGEGLLIGVEFCDEGAAGEFMLDLLERRVIANHSLNAGRVVRFTPSATLAGDEADWLLDAVEHAARNLFRLTSPATARS